MNGHMAWKLNGGRRKRNILNLTTVEKFMMQFFSSSLTGNGALIIKLASSKVDWKILKKNGEKAFDLGVITHELTSLGGDGMFTVRILIIDDGV